ncbi:hypothetical protein CVT24_005296 [Panaeolus cyanescens]|uniref:Uncharacterized protein n=1 Tax=Panaeolus cyanescens TaxID=181874 RepID=A0A409Y8V5_9AGAR|nr:hypothetical protein CVT24_005296 [Panaeolus cyanescens]
MPRPRPLTNVSSAIPWGSDQQLTPRTPHSATASGSRTSRLEQGFSKIQLSDEGLDAPEYDDQVTLQSAPLLASSSTARFGASLGSSTSAKRPGARRARRPAELISHVVTRLPLVLGVFVAGVLLILIVLSFTRPGALHRYVGATLPESEKPSSTIASAPAVIPTDLSVEGSMTPTMGSQADPHHHSTTQTDSQVHTGNTVHLLSYENYTTFPLAPFEYLHECAAMHQGYMSHGDYWEVSRMGAMDVKHHDEGQQSLVCDSTITYMLDGKAGLTADLALMAQAAALARERNRTFFVDDTYWDRGKWTYHFQDVTITQPGPQPGCQPPPPNELVACPRTARCVHWVINSRTAKFHFGHAFSDHYENPYAHQLNRLKPMFNRALESFRSTILPNDHNMDLIRLAKKELKSFLLDVNRGQADTDPRYLSIHIRRGDRKTYNYAFKDRKIPIGDYLTGTEQTWNRLSTQDQNSGVYPVLYLASDSSTAQKEFSEKWQGETFSLFQTSNQHLNELASPAEYVQKEFDDFAVETRIKATRGMVVDLALLSGIWSEEGDILPEAIVCGVSSTVCKLSAIGLGWDRAFGDVDEMGIMDDLHKRWVDVDEKGQSVPVWQPFELF